MTSSIHTCMHRTRREERGEAVGKSISYRILNLSLSFPCTLLVLLLFLYSSCTLLILFLYSYSSYPLPQGQKYSLYVCVCVPAPLCIAEIRWSREYMIICCFFTSSSSSSSSSCLSLGELRS
jgi:hypothetical protein